MVYCGRPSASCALCRASKRRCDRVVPECGHCRRTGQQCPGYQDTSRLRIRDETRRIINRVHPDIARRKDASSGDANDWTLPGLDESQATSWSGVSSSGPIREATGRRGTNKASQALRDDNSPRYFSVQQGTLQSDPGVWNDTANIFRDFNAENDLNTRNENMLFNNETSWWQNGGLNPVGYGLAAPAADLYDLGANYFLANYVLETDGPSPGFLNYASHMLADYSGDTELSRVAVQAVGLAGLANTTDSERIMQKARTSYAEVIERVNVALVNPRTAAKDSTLFAVMVLSMFESVTCSGKESYEAWQQHISGVSNLLVHRGTAQFETEVGRRIIGEALYQVYTLCTRYGHAIPPRLRFLRVEKQRRVVHEAPTWTISTIFMEVMTLYHRVVPDRKIPFLSNEWEEMLSRAAELVQRLKHLEINSTDEWCYQTVKDPTADPRIVYSGTYHIYHNVWVAKVWNGLRACRILLNEAMYSLFVREGPAWAPQDFSSNNNSFQATLQGVMSATTEMRDGIFASVPQMLGYVQHDAVSGVFSLVHESGADMPHLTPASGAYFLLWYLHLAGNLPMNDRETRDWAANRLFAIRAATGIQNAIYFAENIRKQPALMHAMISPRESQLCS